MFEQLDLIRGELLNMADRVHSLEAPAPRVVERQAVLPEVKAPAVVNAPAPRGYEVAARLARSGATSEELISSCGLSRHEADLLLRLHRGDATRAKPATTAAPVKPSTVPRTRLSAVG